MKTGFSVRHQIAGSGSLIPPDKQYHQQRNHYQYVTLKAGLRRLHGVRHHYAQERYQGLTGWQCPHQGGPTRKQLTEEQKYVDIRARITISNEMGHAIDKNEQGQGLGEHVLMDALVRAYRHSNDIASMAVVVDAIDKKAIKFYQHYHFLTLSGHSQKLFLPIKEIEQLMKH